MYDQTDLKLPMMILEILKEYSDEEHTLSQKDIQDKLYERHGKKWDRRTIKNHILSLASLDEYDIVYTETPRMQLNKETGEKENNPILSNFALVREFDSAELRMLIDAVLFSKTLPGAEAKRLINKLEGFGSKYFKSKVSHVNSGSSLARTANKNVLSNVNDINDAIDQKKKITFRYMDYGIDFRLYDRGNQYIVNPYQMVAANGYYYLIGNLDKYKDISYYRIDRISNVEILEEPLKPMKQVEGLEHGLNLPTHMAEHIYMYSGPSVRVKLLADARRMNELVDWLGKDFRVKETDKVNQIEITVNVNESSMYYWALQYGPSVEILEPESLRHKIADTIKKMNEKYSR